MNLPSKSFKEFLLKTIKLLININKMKKIKY